MKTFTIDLYDYFKIDRKDNKGGFLDCTLLHNSREINLERKHKAMLVIPGGGYAGVSDREGEPVANYYLTKDFNTFVLTYSVAPSRHPTQLLEAVMGMLYIRRNAKELSIDENKVCAVGFSAGGHLTAMLGSYYNAQEVKDILHYEDNARPNAIILGYPVITSIGKGHFDSFYNLCGNENVELQRKLSIENLVNKDSSPAFIWATYDDGCVPVQNSLIVATAYENNGVPFSIHIWGKGWHGLSVADESVYHETTYNEVVKSKSKSVKLWLDLSNEWLEEQGIITKDL